MNKRRMSLMLALSLLLLVSSSVLVAWPSISHASLVRALVRAGVHQPEDVLHQPFLCLRPPLTSEPGRAAVAEALLRLQAAPASPANFRLQLAAACLLDDFPPFDDQQHIVSSDPYLLVQFTLAENPASSEVLAQKLVSAGVEHREVLDLSQVIVSSQPEYDLRPLLLVIGQQDPANQDTWRLWLQIGFNLEQEGDWLAAADWLQEGEALQERAGVRFYASSFALHIGRFYQSYSQPRDPQTALGYYNRALELDQYFYSGEQAVIHLYRGEVYRSLKDSHTPDEALAEFEQALALQPDLYWAKLSIGHLYLYDLKDADQAEPNYRQALEMRPDQPNTYFHLGDLYRIRGEPAQAEAWFRQALARQPDYPPALEGLKALGVDP